MILALDYGKADYELLQLGMMTMHLYFCTRNPLSMLKLACPMSIVLHFYVGRVTDC